jgi:hyperosmotically inducible periplasmic protein
MIRLSLPALALATMVAAGVTPTPASAAPSVAFAPQAPTDAQLKDRIEHRLDVNDMTRKYDIDVAVDNGVATLTGSVATSAQKAEAGTLAKVTGVTRVENKVTVDPKVNASLMDKTKHGMSKTGEAINDAWITTKVKYHLTGEDLLKDSDINVDTNNHVVTLKGTVRSAAGRARAVLLAKDTEGVSKVVDQLTIGPKKH